MWEKFSELYNEVEGIRASINNIGEIPDTPESKRKAEELREELRYAEERLASFKAANLLN